MLEYAAFIKQRVERLDYRIPEKLTKQQREILALICQGCSDREIAGELCIARSTANKHRQTIYQLFNVHSSNDVAFIAFRHRLFSPIGLNLTDQIEREQQREGSRLMFALLLPLYLIMPKKLRVRSFSQ
ncbi:MAG TPA: LuxR C-terminal-related transcriptional regulator [Ktedonobacteraceae bacterium]|nr:LuxR C-terminal-related transcriptional regulator [Ktedonobacteraceae bacterium]